MLIFTMSNALELDIILKIFHVQSFGEDAEVDAHVELFVVIAGWTLVTTTQPHYCSMLCPGCMSDFSSVRSVVFVY